MKSIMTGRYAREPLLRVMVLVAMAALIVLVVAVPMAAAAPTFTTHRVSLEAGVAEADGDSVKSAVSADGRFVAYESLATDILGGGLAYPDTYGLWDIFRYDRLTGETAWVSRDRFIGSASHWANSDSRNPSISADGRYVAFESEASDLVAGDGNGVQDIFVRDMVTDTTTRVSIDWAGGDPDGGSANPSISGDGSRVAFHSAATDLVTDDDNGQIDVFVEQMSTGATWRCLGRGSVEPNVWSGHPSISSDGHAVAFVSAASNLVPGDDEGFSDVFYWNVGASFSSTPARVSVSQYNGAGGNGSSWNPSVSANGSFVAYDTYAGNLDPGDGDIYRDVYVWQQGYGDNGRVSVSSTGGDANAHSWSPSISGDGRYVAFESAASNLIAAGDDGGFNDIYMRDTTAQVSYRMSVDRFGGNPAGDSTAARISADGMHVAFSTLAPDLISGDTNGKADVYVRSTRAMAAVYRFYNMKNGSHFYTPSIAERDNVIATLSKTYKYEGEAYFVNSSLSWQPLYRFYHKKKGSHFYTASAAERDEVIARLSAIYSYEGPTYSVTTRAGSGTTVWRFYNKKNGSHFYTASVAEKNNVVANLSATYTLEGPAFYLPQ